MADDVHHFRVRGFADYRAHSHVAQPRALVLCRVPVEGHDDHRTQPHTLKIGQHPDRVCIRQMVVEHNQVKVDM